MEHPVLRRLRTVSNRVPEWCASAAGGSTAAVRPRLDGDESNPPRRWNTYYARCSHRTKNGAAMQTR